MNKRIIVGLLAVAGLVGGAVWAYPREAQCAICAPLKNCITSKNCGEPGKCVCIKKPGAGTGECASVE